MTPEDRREVQTEAKAACREKKRTEAEVARMWANGYRGDD